MPLIAKKKQGDSNNQIIGEFRKLTMFDEVLEKAKMREMEGFLPPSVIRKRRKTEKRKEQAKLRRRNARSRGLRKR